jgi:two-component system, cell cycle sensor histidine kinase and response regulator CckA
VQGSQVSVLMVEDNAGDATLVQEYLGASAPDAYQIVHCERLAEALDHLANEPCDVILLDLSLPDSRGLSTFDAIQNQAAGIPIVILTGFNDEVLAAQAIKIGAKDFLPKKSLDGSLLNRAIRYAIERTQWEQTIRRNEEHIRRIEKMESIGRVSAGIAHNFNNLLTVIMGNCELIANRPGLDAEVVNRVKVIQDAAGKASAFTKSMMAFGRMLPLHECVFDLNLVITELEPLLKGGIGKGIHVDIELHPQVGCIRSDPAQIEQVMLNLVLNACDAMPGGGPITIRTLPVDIASALAGIPDAVPPGRYAALIVGDTGCGIDVSDLQRVFEPFYTTKDEFSGRGMGLATVYGIVSQNRGFIQVASQPGSGTTFTIYLPSYLPSGTQQLPAPTPEGNGRSGGHETVLLVEDDRQISDLLAEYLNGDGYKVLAAKDGEAGLAMYLQHADGISLVISDIAMPRMDGQNLVRRIRKLSPEMPIILMTGAPGEHGMDAKDAALPARILMKPFSPRILARAVRDELDRSASRHHRPE